MGDMGDVFRAMREAQRDRRAERLPARTAEIEALREQGHRVRRLTDYQFRVDGVVDLYPIHRRYHVLATGRRGTYRSALGLVRSVVAKGAVGL